MSIDYRKTKQFWTAQAHKHAGNLTGSSGNLEYDATLRELKNRLEREKIASALDLTEDMNVLDLGAGAGLWSAFFALQCKTVYAVEYVEKFIELGKKRMAEKGITNVFFVHNSAQGFSTEMKFDLIFISGLFVYLNDADAHKVLSNVRVCAKAGARLLVRDGTGLTGRYEINDRYSEYLGAHYSALYRTRDEYIAMFRKAHFRLLKDENMFEEGCVLNKFPQTRLRLYVLEKEKEAFC